MTGLVVFVIFCAGWVAGVLTMMWSEDDKVPEDIRRRMDKWDGTR